MRINREIISSLSNNIIKDALQLKDKKHRKEQGCFLLENLFILKDIKDISIIKQLFVTPKASDDTRFKNLINKWNIDYYLVSDKVMDKLTDTVNPLGVAAIIKIEKVQDNPCGMALIMDGIMDPGNAGTIIRTAAALNIKDIYAIDCVDIYNSKTIRSTMGGFMHTRIRELKRNIQDLDYLKKQLSAYNILAMDMDGDDIFNHSISNIDKTALIIGSEAQGVSDELMAISNSAIALPMQSDMESLNASVAAGIAMYILKNKAKTL